jgi:hypothetical protein
MRNKQLPDSPFHPLDKKENQAVVQFSFLVLSGKKNQVVV